MSASQIHDVLAVARSALAELQQRRDEILKTIQDMEAGIRAFEHCAVAMETTDLRGAKAPESLVDIPLVEDRYDDLLPPTRAVSPAQKILACLRRTPGLTAKQVSDRVHSTVPAHGGKSSRKLVSSAMHDLRRRGKIREEQGRLFVLEGVRA